MPGLSTPPGFSAQGDLDGEHELDALLAGLHVLGSELRVLGDLAHARGEGPAGIGVDVHARLLAQRELADARLRHVDLDVEPVQIHQREQRCAFGHALSKFDGAGEDLAGDRARDGEVDHMAPLLGQLGPRLPSLAIQRVALGAHRVDLLCADVGEGELFLDSHHRLLGFLDAVSLDVGLEPGVLGFLARDQIPSDEHRRPIGIPLCLKVVRLRSLDTGLGLPQRGSRLLDAQRHLSFGHVELRVRRPQPLGQRVDLLLGRADALPLSPIIERREDLAGADCLTFVDVQRHDRCGGLGGERRDAPLDPAAGDDQTGGRRRAEPRAQPRQEQGDGEQRHEDQRCGAEPAPTSDAMTLGDERDRGGARSIARTARSCDLREWDRGSRLAVDGRWEPDPLVDRGPRTRGRPTVEDTLAWAIRIHGTLSAVASDRCSRWTRNRIFCAAVEGSSTSVWTMSSGRRDSS